AFSQKRIWQRAAIVSARPLANLVLTVVAFAILFSTIGQPYPPAVVGEVTPNSAAKAASLKAGDRILSVNGVNVQYFSDFFVMVRESNGGPLGIVLHPGDRKMAGFA